jgi:hypothetical protein
VPPGYETNANVVEADGVKLTAQTEQDGLPGGYTSRKMIAHSGMIYEAVTIQSDIV